MPISKKHFFLGLQIFALLVCVFGTARADDELRVLTSIKPVHSILSGLMQGLNEPDLLLKEDALPFSRTLTAEDDAAISKADIIVWVGPELEAFLIEPLKLAQSEGKLVLTMLDNPEIKILQSRWHDDSENPPRDPYFWMDSRNVLIMIDELARALIHADNARAHLYRRNRDKLFEQIAELDRQLEYGYRGLKSGIGIAWFDTLQYFEQAYALKIRQVIAESPGIPPDAGHLLKSGAALRNGEFSCLIVDQSLDMPEYDLLTAGAKVNTGTIDIFGSQLEPGPDLYFKLMQNSTAAIKQCLRYEALPEGVAEVEESSPLPSIVGGKFLLMDHTGQVTTEQDLLGKYQLLSFGYTSCPDICPTSLQVMSLAMKQLGDRADLLNPYFITVDPQRDDVEKIRNYVGFFDKRLTGLTGSPAMIERVAKQYKVVYEKVNDEDGDPEMYTMDHTASLYLMAPDGSFVTKFAYGISPEQLVEGLDGYLPR